MGLSQQLLDGEVSHPIATETDSAWIDTSFLPVHSVHDHY